MRPASSSPLLRQDFLGGPSLFELTLAFLKKHLRLALAGRDLCTGRGAAADTTGVEESTGGFLDLGKPALHAGRQEANTPKRGIEGICTPASDGCQAGLKVWDTRS